MADFPAEHGPALRLGAGGYTGRALFAQSGGGSIATPGRQPTEGAFCPNKWHSWPCLVRTFSPEMIWPVWVRPNCQPTPVYSALPGLDGKQQLALRRVVEAVLPAFRQHRVGLLVDFEILVLHYVPVVGVLLAIETGHSETFLLFAAG